MMGDSDNKFAIQGALNFPEIVGIEYVNDLTMCIEQCEIHPVGESLAILSGFQLQFPDSNG